MLPHGTHEEPGRARRVLSAPTAPRSPLGAGGFALGSSEVAAKAAHLPLQLDLGGHARASSSPADGTGRGGADVPGIKFSDRSASRPRGLEGRASWPARSTHGGPRLLPDSFVTAPRRETAPRDDAGQLGDLEAYRYGEPAAERATRGS